MIAAATVNNQFKFDFFFFSFLFFFNFRAVHAATDPEARSVYGSQEKPPPLSRFVSDDRPGSLPVRFSSNSGYQSRCYVPQIPGAESNPL